MENSNILYDIFLFFIFASGFGWGKWHAESSARKEKILAEEGRLVVSVPMNKDDASRVFEALSILSKRAKEMHDE